MRRLIKHILVAVLYYTGILYLLRLIFNPAAEWAPLILMYHQVFKEPEAEDIFIRDGLHVKQDTFDKQLAYLKKKYTIISLAQLVEFLQNKQPLPKKTVVITFDDGWRDNYLYAYPILKKHHIPATIFLTTDFIDSRKLLWFLEAALLHQKGGLTFERFSNIIENLPVENKKALPASSYHSETLKELYQYTDKILEFLKQFDAATICLVIDKMAAISGYRPEEKLKKRWMLNWDEINSMTDLVEFGSHGCSHRIMTLLTPEETDKELIESKKMIEEKTGRPVRFFAYPNGDYNATVKKKVNEAGYAAAIATSGREPVQKTFDLYAIKRLGIHEGVSAGLGGVFSRALFYFAISRRKEYIVKNIKADVNID